MLKHVAGLLLLALIVAWVSVSVSGATSEDTYAHEAPALVSLRHVEDISQVPERDIRRIWPAIPAYRGMPAVDENSAYVLQRDDVLEVFLTPEMGGTSSSPELSPRIKVYLPSASPVALINDVRRPKIPWHLLPQESTVDFRVTGSPAGEWKAVVNLTGARTWRDVLQAFATSTVSGPGGYRPAVRLIPVASEYVAPGDTVDVFRFADDDEREQLLQQFTVRVDQNGYLWLPPLTTGLTNPYGNFPKKSDTLSRSLHGSVDQSAFRVRVAEFGTAHVSLQQVAEVLSGIGVRSAAADIGIWKQFGVDEQFLPKDWRDSGVRYHLQSAEERSWTIVDEHGRRLQVRSSGRQLLVEAAMVAYRELTGTELVSGASMPHAVSFLTIVPAQHGTSSRPFFGRVDSGDLGADLQYVALCPGDTVFVSRTAPAEVSSSLP